MPAHYVYWIDNDLGLCHMRVPTGCPFRLQVYSNGHSYLARQLSRRKIEYRVLDKAARAMAFDAGCRCAAI